MLDHRFIARADLSARAGVDVTRKVHGVEINGVHVDPETRCAHYYGSTDIVALKFKCCGKWFPCHRCHDELAGHRAVVWPEQEFDELVVLCGGCGRRMSAREYLDCNSICPNCGRSFNPGCAKHAHYYFAVL
jgi:uncharacterized CHY-type Zn-finger protein